MSHETAPFDPADRSADPLHLFRRLPAVELDARELADMKRSVHEMLRAKAIEAESSTELPRRQRGGGAARFASSLRRTSRPLRLAAAAACLLTAASLLVPSLAPVPLRVAQQRTPIVSLLAAPTLADLAAAEALPLVENVSGDPELIQIEDREMSLVVVAALR